LLRRFASVLPRRGASTRAVRWVALESASAAAAACRGLFRRPPLGERGPEGPLNIPSNTQRTAGVHICLSVLANEGVVSLEGLPRWNGQTTPLLEQHLSAPRYGAVCIFSAEATLWLAGTNGVPTSRRLVAIPEVPLQLILGVEDPRVTFASQ
jgi:hypothetical protein